MPSALLARGRAPALALAARRLLSSGNAAMTLEQALLKVPEALFCDRTREPFYALATPSAICKFSDSDAFTRV